MIGKGLRLLLVALGDHPFFHCFRQVASSGRARRVYVRLDHRVLLWHPGNSGGLTGRRRTLHGTKKGGLVQQTKGLL
jgi:hypothetical protein